MTLPDLLRPNLDLVFVGIIPSIYSVEMGHYFARKTNRFWPCLSASSLSLSIRQTLGVDRLDPSHDVVLLDHGIGFTDVVKRPTARAGELSPAEFAAGARDLVAKLEIFQPKIACFQGIMGFHPFLQVLAPALPKPVLGEQQLRLGQTRLFVVPSPSPANAHASPAIQTEWYDRLATLR